MLGWRQIDVAPRDGTEVIAMDSGGRVRRAVWGPRTGTWRNLENNTEFSAVWWVPCPPLVNAREDLPQSA